MLNGQRDFSESFLTRLAWELPLALILVLLGMMLGGHWLGESHLSLKQKPKSADVRIYELPPSAPSRAGQSVHRHYPLTAIRPKQLRRQNSGAAEGASRSPASTTMAAVRQPNLPKAHRHVEQPTTSRHGHYQPPTSPKANTKRHVPATVEQRPLNWADLAAQINLTAKATASHSAFLQVHDPHTLTARYYIAAILRALQRTGDMIYNGQQTGAVGVRLIIGANGNVEFLGLDPWNGASRLVPVVRSIVNVSTPFSPFPVNLAHHTKRLKIEVLMRFLGSHDISTE